MNSLQRIVAAIQFREVDRVPVIAQVFGHAACQCGVSLESYLRDGKTLARCQLQALQRYRYDAVFAFLDAGVETEALGSVLRFSEDHYPAVEQYALSGRTEWGLKIPDPERNGRMPEVLSGIRILRGELEDEFAIVGCVLGPITLSAQLLGLESALYLAIDDCARLQRLMDFATDVAIAFGQAQLRAGAHLVMVFDPVASPAVIPPSLFRELELPRLQRLFARLSGAGTIANWLHIAGPVTPILRYYPDIGVNLANIDYEVSAVDASRELPNTSIDGNIKPLLFSEGSPKGILVEAHRLLHSFRERRGFILSSGCEIPPEAKPENVAAMVEASRTH